jgi:C4-dicarboxylate transporter, DctM subunit
MIWYIELSIVAAAILLLLAIRMPLGFVFGVVGAVGIILSSGFASCMAIPQQFHDMLSDYVLVTIPLFVLMAEILASAGFIPDLYRAFEKFTGRIRGSIAIATIIASAVLASVLGSSYVATASIGRMTIPEMLKRGYSPKLTGGTVAAGGSLGILIPPSLAFIIYGYMSGASIAALFVAGIIPGILLSALFILAIVSYVLIFPDSAKSGEQVEFSEKFRGLLKVAPILVIAAAVIGSIYLGIATPGEAASIGCICSIILCMLYGKFDHQMFLIALQRAVSTSGMLLMLMCTAKVLAFMMSKVGIMYGLQQVLTGLPDFQFILIIILTLFILGMFLEGTSIIVLTTPIFAPALISQGLSLIWFGVILVIFIEVALLTPPVGMNCYIVAEIGKSFNLSLEEVFKGIFPFLAALFVTALLIIIFPGIATWLPSTMK